MIGSIIGGALQLGGTIFGGIKASKAMKRVKKNIEEQRKKNQTWYDRRYNEDATQRADAQRVLAITQENIRNRNRQAAGAQAVMGGTEESVAAAKAANNQALSDAASQIAVNGERRKDQIEQQYQQNENALTGQLSQMEANKANSIANAVKGLSKAAGSIADGIDSLGDRKAEVDAMPDDTDEENRVPEFV